MKNIRVVTHKGRFHFDEVLAIGMLTVFGGYKPTVIRTRDINIINEEKANGSFIIDVGMEFDGIRLFDHHHDSSLRSSAGLIFDFLKLEDQYPELTELVIMADLHDLGIKQAGKFEMPIIVSNFNGIPERDDIDFNSALEFTIRMLNSIKHAQEKLEKTRLICEIAEEIVPGILFVDSNPGKWDVFINGKTRPDIKAVAWLDRHQGKYKIQVTPVDIDSFELHGHKLHSSDLMEFVHNNGFLAVAKDFKSLLAYIQDYSNK